MPSDYAKKRRAEKAKAAPVKPPAPPSPTPPGKYAFILKTPLGVDYSAWEPGMVMANMNPRPVFVYSRASLGKAYVDPVMRYYEMQSWQLGIPFSPYHFYQPDHLQEQVDNFMRATVGMEWSDKQPPMLDCEYLAKWPLGIRGQQLANQYKYILDQMEGETGIVPCIYTSPSCWGQTFYDPTGKKDRNNMQAPSWTSRYPVIVAWYANNLDAWDTLPKTMIPSGFKIIKGWQYAANGRSAGYINVANDLNQMYL